MKYFSDPNQQRARPHFSRTGARMVRPSIRRICKVASGLGHAQCIAHPDVIGLSCGFVEVGKGSRRREGGGVGLGLWGV